MPKQHRNAFRSDFNLGGAQAEADPLLSDAFFESGHYAAAESRSDPRCFFVGRTGSGKSAILRRLEEVRPDHVIRITPEDLALPYITDLQAFRYLEALQVHMDPLFIALWKHVLLVEVLRKRYRIDSEAAKQNVLNSIRDRIKRDPGKHAAINYLDEFDGRFWCEADERVRHITETFEEKSMRPVRRVATGDRRVTSEGSGDGIARPAVLVFVGRGLRPHREPQVVRLEADRLDVAFNRST